VYLPEIDLWLDSLRKKDTSLISHAHSDHTARHLRPVLTPNTGLILSDYLKKTDPITLQYHEPMDRGKYTLTLYPAGHCLGSAQVLIESKFTGERVLYTGDIKVRSSPTNEPLEAVPCDTLIIESTYGRPKYVFPDQDRVLATACNTLRNWLSKGEKPVVQGWKLGKSQEILHHLLDQGFDMVVDEPVYQIAQVYQQAGVSFPGELKLRRTMARRGRATLPSGAPDEGSGKWTPWLKSHGANGLGRGWKSWMGPPGRCQPTLQRPSGLQ